MAVGVDETGGDEAARRIYHFLAGQGLDLLGHQGDLLSLHPDVPGDKAALVKEQDRTVLDDHGVSSFLSRTAQKDMEGEGPLAYP